MFTEQECVIVDVQKERKRQDDKWGLQRHHYGIWMGILMEEVGEVAEAVNLHNFGEGKQSDADDLYEELIQVAAVSVAIAEQVLEERRKTNE